MKKISREGLLALFIGTVVITANSFHILTERISNGNGLLFTGIAHYFADYFLYVSNIVQGSRGAWLFTYPVFTNEPGSPTWIYWIYTVIGKFAYVGIGPFAAYTISLFVFSAFLLYIWWMIAGMVFPKHPATRLAAFLFMTTASHIPNLGDFWFSPMPALNRLGGVPHQMFQTILLLAIIVLSVAIRIPNSVRRDRYRMVLLAVISFLAATVNPIQMLLIVVCLGIVEGITLIRRGYTDAEIREPHRAHNRIRVVSLWLMVALPALIGALMTNAEFARQPILTAAKTWEDSQRIHVSFIRFLFAIGPIALLIPFGIRKSLARPSPIVLMLMFYGTLSLIMFFSPLPILLNTSPVRWLSPAAYLILPLLAAYGWQNITEFTDKLTGKKHIAIVTGHLLLFVYVAATVPSLTSQISDRVSPLRTDPLLISLNHIGKPYMEILTAVDMESEGTSDHPVTLTDPTIPLDVLVPVFTKAVSFTGHPIHTLYPQTKERLRQRFFSGSMDDAEAIKFFRDHRIRIVIMSANASRVLPRYANVTEIFRNTVASVYEIHL